MNNNKLIINHIKTYTTFEWLVFIKVLENMTDDKIKKIEHNDSERNLLQNPNWYLIIIDLAIRFSDYKNTKVNINALPTKFDYRKFVSLYLNSKDNEKNFKKDLNSSLNIALSRYADEQLRRYSPAVNNFGRLLDLFKDKEMLLKQLFGLSPKQILFFTALNIDKHSIYKPFDFSSIFRLLKEYDSKITAKNLNKFINIMSISIKQYRLKSKELGNTKDKIKTIRLIEQFPIIDLSDNFYFIPSLNALIESLTYKLFKTLNDLQVKPQNFKREFGNTFENYTRRLTKFRHNEYIYECNELITEIKKEKAEYYLLKDNSTIVIESKLLPVNDEMILNGDLLHIKKNFIETINKAFSQIKSTFDHISVENKYAIIVIHTHTLLLESSIELLKDNINYEFIDNVIILSIIDYEILIDNSFEKIIEFFNQKKTHQKKHISIFFSNKQNMYLEKVFYSAFDEILNNNN